MKYKFIKYSSSNRSRVVVAVVAAVVVVEVVIEVKWY